MITIVSGPGYTGKTNFCENNGFGIIDFPDDFRVEHLMTFVKKSKRAYSGMILHYNTYNVSSDPHKHIKFLERISVDAEDEIRVVVLVTPLTELRERIAYDMEISWRPRERIQEAKTKVFSDGYIKKMYSDWIKIVKKANCKEILFALSSKGSVQRISEEEVMAYIDEKVTTTASKYTCDQILEILDSGKIGKYHRVELPFGLHTKGQDVSERFPIVFPKEMNGKTLLDIGCGYGAFAFEAERRGAVVFASEMNSERLQGASILADIIGSNVKFTSRNFFSDEIPSGCDSDEKFDIVMALNVLHHVPDVDKALALSA